jgi:hypothetical protein
MTVGAGVAQAAPSANHNPVGTFHFDVAHKRIHVYGTATDPDTTAPLKLTYLVNGKVRETGLTNAAHAWGRTWDMPYGAWTIQVVASNAGAGTANTVLGTRSINLVNSATRNPRGSSAISVSGQTLTISGLAFDWDAISYGLFVRVFDGNRQIMVTRANGTTHAYLVRMKIAPGNHLIRVIAYNVGYGTQHPTIGLKWVTAKAPATAGYAGYQAVAASLLASYGWGRDQMAPLIALWNRESGWNPLASNGGSGAYGIPQALPGSKMASAGADWRTNGATQIRWGLSYIKGVYGSPAAAWAHSQATGWY